MPKVMNKTIDCERTKKHKKHPDDGKGANFKLEKANKILIDSL